MLDVIIIGVFISTNIFISRKVKYKEPSQQVEISVLYTHYQLPTLFLIFF